MKDTRSVWRLIILALIAMVSLLIVDYLSAIGFDMETVWGKRLLLMVCLRSVLGFGPLLLLMLVGYVAGEHRRLWLQWLLMYLSSSALLLLYKKFCLGFELSLSRIVTYLLGGFVSHESWIMGVSLLVIVATPVLNYLTRYLPTRRWWHGWLLLLAIVSLGPSLVNVYNFSGTNWWWQPRSSFVYTLILPWDCFWLTPIFAYYVGSYYRRFAPRTKNPYLLPVWLLLMMVAAAVYNCWRSWGGIFVYDLWNQDFSAFNFALAWLIFVGVASLSFKFVKFNLPSFLRFGWLPVIITSLSVSEIASHYLVTMVNGHEMAIIKRFDYLPLVVIVVSLTSLVLAGGCWWLVWFGSKSLGNSKSV